MMWDLMEVEHYGGGISRQSCGGREDQGMVWGS